MKSLSNHAATWPVPMGSAVLGITALGIGGSQAAHAQIQDGGFETPVSNGIQTFYTGDTFGGWHVDAGSVDIVPAQFWQQIKGNQSLDVSGYTAGTLSQDVPTTAGQAYDLSFYLAGNTHDRPDIKQLNIIVNNTLTKQFTFDTDSTSTTNMGWRLSDVLFTASSSTTHLTLQSLNDSANGPVVDDFKLTPVPSTSAVPEPSSLISFCLPALGLGGLLLRARKKATRST